VIAIPRANKGEDLFRFSAKACGLPPFEEQFAFAPGRKFRADFAWPSFKLLFEAHGAVFTQGRHTRGAGFTADCERRSIAAILGYSMIEATTDQIKSGEAIGWVEIALLNRGWKR
jgi:very-short-patch-repair endonuclease